MTQRRPDLDQFFHPDGVALLGRLPSEDPAVLAAKNADRWGTRCVYVNPRGGSLGDIPVYRKVTDIPGPIGLAVVDVRPTLVAPALEEIGDKGIPYALVFTAGFREVGPEGARMEREVAETARRRGIRLVGPNTNTNAFERLPEVPGLRGRKIGVLTQSGHNGRPIVQGSLFGIGFSRWIPSGNEADLELADFLEYLAGDDETGVIAAYVEGFRDPTQLRRALEAANEERVPVVMLKIGSTAAGARGAMSHTGHLTGSDAVVDGLFRQYGLTRVRDLDELLETSALFAKLPEGTGPNVCLYSISGGSATLMAEVAEAAGLSVPRLSAATQRRLHEILPGFLSVSNPVDNGAVFMRTASQEERLRVLDLILEDPAVDVLVVGITGALGTITDNFGKDLLAYAERAPKPVVVTWNSFKVDEPGFRDVVASGVPMFRSFRNCFAALAAFDRYRRAMAHARPRRARRGRMPAAASRTLARAGTLTHAEGRGVLDAFGVEHPADRLADSASEAVRAAADLGPTVAMKIASVDVPHRSDAGLVRLGVTGAAAARRAYAELTGLVATAAPGARVEGVVVQEQVAGGGVEMIVGLSRDEALGLALTIGVGGVFAEVFQDVSVRPLPVDRRDVTEMVDELRGTALLRGARGRPRADERAFVDLVLRVAALGSASGDRIVELDLNPVIVGPAGSGAKAVDWLVVSAGDPSGRGGPGDSAAGTDAPGR